MCIRDRCRDKNLGKAAELSLRGGERADHILEVSLHNFVCGDMGMVGEGNAGMQHLASSDAGLIQADSAVADIRIG